MFQFVNGVPTKLKQKYCVKSFQNSLYSLFVQTQNFSFFVLSIQTNEKFANQHENMYSFQNCQLSIALLWHPLPGNFNKKYSYDNANNRRHIEIPLLRMHRQINENDRFSAHPALLLINENCCTSSAHRQKLN